MAVSTPSQRIAAAVGLVQPAEQLGQGGLAGAVLADQGDDLAGADLQDTSVTAGVVGARVGEADVLDPQPPEAGRGRVAPPAGLDLGRHGQERGEVLDEQRRLVQHAGAEDGVHQPLAEDEHGPGGRPGVGQADPAVEGQDEQGGDDPGEHDRGGQVAEQRHAQPLPGHLAQLDQVLVVQPVEALAEEVAEAEGAQLLGGVLARQQHVEVVAAALGLGHAVAEPEHQLAAPGHGDQQGHGRRQDQRHQPGLEGEQGQGDAGDADQGAGQAGEPLDDLPGPELAAAGRPDQPVVEGRGVVGLQLDLAGHVDDLGLGVPGGELGQDLAVLPADGGQEPEPGRDHREQQQLGQDRLGPAAAAPGRDHPVEHALAEQQDRGQADPVDHLDGQDDQQLAGPGGPDELDRLAAQSGQAPQLPVDLWRLVEVGPGEAAGGDVAAGGVLATGLLAHGCIVTPTAVSRQPHSSSPVSPPRTGARVRPGP